ncbi:SIMPL domain-containing protein, partial [Hansschlegelia beijingensis]|uniref:SIMPL domain-containing protein n=1 Tax=Hansschlegelia beijingensis TaxID=1133344 RepID=UPI00387F0B41
MRRALALAIALAALPLAAHAEGERREPSVSVVGEGSVSAVPDLAMVTSGVVSRAPTAAAALKANAAAMTKVMAALKDAGVEERDIATSGLSVQPQYDYGDGSAPRTPKLVGYEVRNAVTVRSRALDKIGDLIDSLVTAGSNQIENLAFEVSDRSEKLDGARREAMADARRKAEIYAAGVGASLGAPLAVSEQEV